MRIAFCGKGGSGKSTLASLFARHLAAAKLPVIVMDGDINQHLGHALGFSQEELKTQRRMGAEPSALHSYVRGTNVRISSVDHVTENTPPGTGSGLIRFAEKTYLSEAYELERNGLRFIALGGHSDEQVGATCYHGFTHKMGTYLNHLIDTSGEYFIGDMCAGADPFAGALASKFDAVFLVVEPTEKSAGVYAQCRSYAEPYSIPLYVVGNKVEDEDDLAFIRAQTGNALVGSLTRSDFVRKQEKGSFQDVSALEPENRALLEKIKRIVDGVSRDWERYQRNNLHFFKTAAESWGNDLYKTDLMQQVDPGFSYMEMTRKTAQAA